MKLNEAVNKLNSVIGLHFLKHRISKVQCLYISKLVTKNNTMLINKAQVTAIYSATDLVNIILR